MWTVNFQMFKLVLEKAEEPEIQLPTSAGSQGKQENSRKKKIYFCFIDFPGGSDGKASAYNVGDPGSIPGSGRSPGEGNGNPLQYSCLENPLDGGTWFRLQSMGSQRVGHIWLTSLSFPICIFDVIVVAPRNLDSSLCFIQPGISHDILCI